MSGREMANGKKITPTPQPSASEDHLLNQNTTATNDEFSMKSKEPADSSDDDSVSPKSSKSSCSSSFDPVNNENVKNGESVNTSSSSSRQRTRKPSAIMLAKMEMDKHEKEKELKKKNRTKRKYTKRRATDNKKLSDNQTGEILLYSVY